MKHIGIIIGIVVILLIGSAWFANTTSLSEGGLISSNGIHWHPHLEVYINGEKQDIPSNIGLLGMHSPMHTHEDDGIVHLEYENSVFEDDIRLGKFFELWGKEFNREQIFNHHNGEGGEVHMFVNGEPNTQFEDYIMRHEDMIEIRYE